MIHPLLTDRRGLVLYLSTWLMLGLVLALPAVGLEVGHWRLALVAFLPPFLLFSSLCLTAWYPCRANPLSETSALRLIAVHGTAALVSSLLWIGLARLWTDWLADVAGREGLAPSTPRYLALGMLFYLLGTSLHYLLLTYEESRQAQERALELKILAREAEIAAYKSQIDPHFLFNCLNSISSLCGTRPEEARQMTIGLGDFLRSSLRLADRDFIPLSEELDLARSYLRIERTRFGDRLEVKEQIDPSALSCEVPSLLLQPLLENALKHGISNLIHGGSIELRVSSDSDRLRVEIDNPVDPDIARRNGEGIGLANVIGRLQLLYRGRAQLETRRTGHHFRVSIDLPCQKDAGKTE